MPNTATGELMDDDGVPLSGEELEEYCKKRGLCPLCAQTRTRKRIFKLFKKNKWEVLTVRDKASGKYVVYKGYCVQPTCFTLEQAKRLAGETGPLRSSISASTSSRRPSSARLLRSSSTSGLSSSASSSEPKPIGDESLEGSRLDRFNSYRSTRSNATTTTTTNTTTNINHNNNNKTNNNDNSNSNINNNSSSKVVNYSYPPSELKKQDVAYIDGDETNPMVLIQTCAETIRQDDSIATLDLSNVNLRHIDMTTLTFALKVNTILQSLILENCSIDDEGIEILADALFEATDMPITKLYLRTNFIKNAGVDALCRFLESNSTLEKLDLSRNSISTRGGVAVFNAFHRNKLSRIRCLNLSHNELWDLDEGSFGIRPFLSKNRTLRVLNLEGNYIHDGGARSLAKGIGRNKYSAMERLYLGWNGIADDGTIAMAEMLEVNKSLRVLGLGENEIGNTGARALLSAMDVNASVREISGLWRNKIDRRFIIVAIRRLLLSHDKSDTKGASGNGGLFQVVEQAPSSRSLLSMRGRESSFVFDGDDIDSRAGDGSDSRVAEFFQYDAKQSNQTDLTTQTIREGEPHVGTMPNMYDYEDYPEMDGAISKKTPAARTIEEELQDALGRSGAGKPVFVVHVPSGEKSDNEEESTAHMEDLSLPPPGSVTDVPAVEQEEATQTFDRLIFFHSSPLAHMDFDTGIHQPIPFRDAEYERRMLEEVTDRSPDAKIEIVQEPATGDQFKSFFAQKLSRVLHISCYGNPEYLTLEDGRGGLERLPLVSLHKLVGAAGGNLKFVFISSFHSRQIGEAFVKAGVPHVVCCHHERTFRDQLSSLFTTAFYRALARKQRLQHAYESALESVRLSSIAKTTRVVFERFCILPEKPESDPYHDVTVFFTRPLPWKDPVADFAASLEDIPRTPEHYIGREVDMFEILEALRVDDIVRVGGVHGSGKDSVVAAVCRYILLRPESFQIEDVFWLPPPEEVDLQEDSLYGDLCHAVNLMKDAEEDIWVNEANLECRERIELELEGKRTILVIDDRKFSPKSLTENLESFVSNLLNGGNAKVILLSAKTSDEVSTISESTVASRPEETGVEVAPLDFKSTARLFGGVSKFICSSGCPAAHSAEELAELFEPPFISRIPDSSAFPSRRRSVLYARMGNGHPAKVVKAATTMSKKDFIDLVGIANRPEVHVDSLGALERELHRRTIQKEKAVAEKNYLRAMDLDKILTEIQGLRTKFPTLEELREEEKAMKKELSDAVSSRQYDCANDLKRELLDLKKKIMKEQRSLTRENVPNGRINEIQAHVRSIIEENERSGSFRTQTATFVINCDDRDCSFTIVSGSLLEFKHETDGTGIVCWTNESCILVGKPVGEKLLERGGSVLEEDIACLPVISGSPWGPVRCGTGNAVMVGPESYSDLSASCVILTVGPLSPCNDDDVDIDDGDTVHYVVTMLRSCYRSSLVLVKHAQLKTVALTMLTTRPSSSVYDQTLKVGLKTLIEEVKFSKLQELHIYASTPVEASKLINMATEMGLRRR